MNETRNETRLFILVDYSRDMSDAGDDSRSPTLSPAKRIYNLNIDRIPQANLNIRTPPAATLQTLPATVDLRSKMPPVYDQGQLGSCTANALVALFEYNASAFKGSRLFLYYNARAAIGTTSYDSGAYISHCVKSLQNHGLCTEALWPYTISQFRVKPFAASYTNALLHRAATVQNIKNDFTSMKSSLNAGWPFAVGIAIYSSFETAAVAATGNVPMPRPGETFLGGHAIVCCGYDDKKQCWIMRNSWGPKWGAAGYFFLPYLYLLNSRLSSDLWNITSLVITPVPKPIPKPVPKPTPKPAPKPTPKPTPKPKAILRKSAMQLQE